MSGEQRKTWTSRIGFVLASAGAAVGLGAIWKFPYMAGTNGGSAFLFPYILMTFTVGAALLIAEVALGRAGRGGIVTAYRNLAGRAWVPAGYLGVLTGFLVLCFYSAIGGWTLAYFAEAATGSGLITDQAELGKHFGSFVSDPVQALGFQWLFLLLNGLIVALDVTKGIERISKFLMPLLFVMMLVLIVRGLMLPGAIGGLEFLFKFDPDAFTWSALLQAMGFTFFSLCVGCGCMLTYGSYLDQNSNLVNGCLWITFLAVIASILGGLMIMPSVFAFGLDPSAGPGLTFITMPAVFAQLPFGQVFAVIFYLCIAVAAITSSVSMIEIVVAFLVDEHKMKRAGAAMLSTLVRQALRRHLLRRQDDLRPLRLLHEQHLPARGRPDHPVARRRQMLAADPREHHAKHLSLRGRREVPPPHDDRLLSGPRACGARLGPCLTARGDTAPKHNPRRSGSRKPNRLDH